MKRVNRITESDIVNIVKKVIKEEMSSKNRDEIYFETLRQALDSVRKKAENMGYEVDEDRMNSEFGSGGISYETTKKATIPLKKDGGDTKMGLRVSIYRMPSGKYELTMYKTS
jgi:hypothetical protein